MIFFVETVSLHIPYSAPNKRFSQSARIGLFRYSIKKVPEAELKEKAQGKHYLIIGGTSGIGKASAVSLLKRGADLAIVGRRQPSDELSAAKFVKKDLSLMRDAAALAD